MDEKELDALVAMTMDAIFLTWDAIGSDVLGGFGSDAITNESVLETVLDADRLVSYGGQDGRAAQDLISAVYAQHGRSVLLEALASRVKLY
jgi:hypothetical protein